MIQQDLFLFLSLFLFLFLFVFVFLFLFLFVFLFLFLFVFIFLFLFAFVLLFLFLLLLLSLFLFLSLSLFLSLLLLRFVITLLSNITTNHRYHWRTHWNYYFFQLVCWLFAIVLLSNSKTRSVMTCAQYRLYYYLIVQRRSLQCKVREVLLLLQLFLLASVDGFWTLFLQQFWL